VNASQLGERCAVERRRLAVLTIFASLLHPDVIESRVSASWERNPAGHRRVCWQDPNNIGERSEAA
jgi:hypothetical protein